MMAQKNILQAFACFIIGFMGQAVADVHATALSEGCAKLNGFVFQKSLVPFIQNEAGILGRAYDFLPNEQIMIQVSGVVDTAGSTVLRQTTSTTGIDLIHFDAQPLGPFNFSTQYEIKTAVSFDINYSASGTGSFAPLSNVQFQFSCKSPIAQNLSFQRNHANNISQNAQLGQAAIAAMVAKRRQNLARHQRTKKQRTRPNRVEKKSTGSALALLMQADGGSAGELQQNTALWGNLSLTHTHDDHVSHQQSSIYGTLMAGFDQFLSEQVLVGGAINLETGFSHSKGNLTETSMTALGISPYLSWRLDDVFSLNALGNVSFFQSRASDRSFDGRTILESDVQGQRWFLNIGGNGFWQIGNWGLLSDLSLNYGELYTGKSKLNDGSFLPGSTQRNGSVAFTLQPSYYWQYDQDLALEPYLLTEYHYDFTMQKTITGINDVPHPNDEDQIRLGLGLNLFGSQFYSGNIEASTVLGRDKYSETSVSGSLRVQF